jgi:uncharacterized protein YbbC (DUF1343 family)
VRRRAFLGAASAPLLLGRPLSAAARVYTGLERLVRDPRAPLRGRRIGLLCHAASVMPDGLHAIDALQGTGAELVRLFAPEHGLRGKAAAGDKVASGVDPESGLKVVSLYGARSQPSPADLGGLEALVVDLQDAGVRFYTYASTLLLCLEAAGGVGLEVIVLDRPNPLGGEQVAGPVRDPALRYSLVSMAPGPLLHGLTLGEMASYVGDRNKKLGIVTVIPMEGWRRGMTWVDTGLRWVDPSPNLRSPEAALAYPGTCLVEATNASEGRGTEAPFLRVGAPWVKAEQLAREAATPGFALEPSSFTPRASAAAPAPKLKDALCRGVRVRVTDAAAARSWELGLRLLVGLRRHPEFAWLGGGAALDRLTGTRAVRAALERGDSVEAILAAEAPALERWRDERRASLLYA